MVSPRPYNSLIDMKNSPLTTILLALLAISAVWSVILCMQYVNHTRAFSRLESEALQMQARQSLLQSLVNDTIEYAKTHQAIDPALEVLGLKRSAPTGATTQTNK